VRGVPSSRPAKEILREARGLAENGVHEMVLTGIQLASYGRDLGKKTIEPRLAPVVEEILSLKGVRRVRLSSYGVADFEAALLPLLGKGLCPHLHLPLQSGDPEVLKSMRRPYSLSGFMGTVEKIRAVFPETGITTDLIAGFPGETAEGFEHTLEAVKVIGFADLHPFPYSDRTGTEAAGRTDKVPDAEKRARMNVLKSLKDDCLRSSAQHSSGKVWEVVAERSDPGFLGGTTDRGLKVIFPAVGRSPGEELSVQVTGFQEGRAVGEVISYVPTLAN
jgi:threonylcarbamoyladenosine tRNA methylthiotransferase MtaB